jgi:hypothetical protein
MVHAGGRPTLYNQAMLDKANLYIDKHFELAEDVVPSIAGLCCFLDVNKSSLYNWAEQYKEFFNTLEKIEKKQERLLLSKGLTGVFTPTITKLMLSNHGYREKQETGEIKDSEFSLFKAKVKAKEKNLDEA